MKLERSCRNHRDRRVADQCVNCHNWLCSDCLVSFQEQLYCEFCRKERVLRLQLPVRDADERLELLASVLLNLGLVALLLAFLGFIVKSPPLGLVAFGVTLLAWIGHIVVRIIKWGREGTRR